MKIHNPLNYVDVDINTGRVFWKNISKYHNEKINKEAGCAKTDKGKTYHVIQIKGQKIKRSQIVFFAANGRWADPLVDHINGNSIDDRITNLREATVQENAMNHKKRKCRSGLPMGVRLVAGSGRYQARITLNKKQHHLGAYDTPEEAAEVYQKARREMFGDFA